MSLVESLVTVFIVAIVLGIMSAMFILLLRSYSTSVAQADLVLSASKMSDVVTKRANQAFDIEPSHSVGGIPYTSDTLTVIFKIASTDSTGSPIPGTFDYSIITADPAGTTHIIEILDANLASSRKSITYLLGEAIMSYHFTYRDADPATSNELFFGVTVAKKIRSSTLTHTLHTYAKLRNK